jgi:Cu-processing system permease protein
MSAIQVIAAVSSAGTPSLFDRFVGLTVDLVALMLPALDQMTRTAWLLEAAPTAGTMLQVLMQTVIYLVFIMAAALFDLYRRNF